MGQLAVCCSSRAPGRLLSFPECCNLTRRPGSSAQGMQGPSPPRDHPRGVAWWGSSESLRHPAGRDEPLCGVRWGTPFPPRSERRHGGWVAGTVYMRAPIPACATPAWGADTPSARSHVPRKNRAGQTPCAHGTRTHTPAVLGQEGQHQPQTAEPQRPAGKLRRVKAGGHTGPERRQQVRAPSLARWPRVTQDGPRLL